MAKGVIPDSSPYNYSAARSTAMKEADVVLVLGAKLNWVLTFGLPPKWNANAKIIQVDIAGDELGKNGGDPSLALVGDIGLTVEKLIGELGVWQFKPDVSPYMKTLKAAKTRNEEKALKKASIDKIPMVYEHVFSTIRTTLHSLSNHSDGDIVYVSEGANAMDISRSIFTMEHPRIRLDAGTYATMGVGLAYAIAAHAAYNFPQPEGSAGSSRRKKIVAIEGDSAFGFSAMEVETMARYQMDVLIFVINNGGLYRGDSDTSEGWTHRQKVTVDGRTAERVGLSATSLGFETRYDKIAEMAGGIGFVVRTPEELRRATEEGFRAKVPVVVNVIVDAQADMVMVCVSPRTACPLLTSDRTSRGSIWLLLHRRKIRSYSKSQISAHNIILHMASTQAPLKT
jgi:2-hydroxyacyl-CoA lyase 1